MTPSADSEKFLSLVLRSETLMGWNAPAGCETACNYTIQYSAPALRCTELAIDEANTLLPVVMQETGDSLRTVYNATILNPLGLLILYPSHGVHMTLMGNPQLLGHVARSITPPNNLSYHS